MRATILFTGLTTLFATGALVGTDSLMGNGALAESRGYSPSTPRTMLGSSRGYSPTTFPQGRGGTVRSGAWRPAQSVQDAKGNRVGGMGWGPGRVRWTGQKRATTKYDDLARKGIRDTKRTGAQLPRYPLKPAQ
jgi:hypothetical protein